ncbi:glycosyltransferase family 4 protein [Hymenobacter qilianensis]|uniref:Glycosyltransferase family 4 protein n=2 Tax=Hymenobacter qilianensis TaxID=1385715 RepID=A0A7H0GSD2_9BACT|nr:glycosyltransferase family 4 protein [Hymenobacter qilianensis]QNP51198.1 glycosyltransferase family 4 protein [Hymenobacter qilianensis]
MHVTQISLGRFHHFHLARQMERNGLLTCIWTGYPSLKLRDEEGIPKGKIRTFPWLHTPYMARGRFGLAKWLWLTREWSWLAQDTLDRHVAAHLKQATALIALSGSGLHSGAVAQRQGGYHICDRGSSHIRFQDRILREEYARFGVPFPGIDPRIIAKEEAEYQQADFITVPSEFVKKSFIEMGVPVGKLVKMVYGARLDRFKQVGEPPKDRFRVLWVGSVSLRKGFLDLLEAFASLKSPNKELLVVGSVEPEMKSLLKRRRKVEGVCFRGTVSNQELPMLYSTAHVFVLPSIEEGLSMVQGEALACGCPVIASTNTGAEDLFSDRVEGYIVPIRAPEKLRERLEQLLEDNQLRLEMSEAAKLRVKALGGWNSYGNSFTHLIKSL